VKNIPIHKPKIPTIPAITATISNPKSTKGCFETMIILDLIASVTFRFPKTIKGIVKKVIKDINVVIRVPIKLNPADSRSIASPVPNPPIINTEIKILKKYGNL
jgi:hypothetical protein